MAIIVDPTERFSYILKRDRKLKSPTKFTFRPVDEETFLLINDWPLEELKAPTSEELAQMTDEDRSLAFEKLSTARRRNAFTQNLAWAAWSIVDWENLTDRHGKNIECPKSADDATIFDRRDKAVQRSAILRLLSRGEVHELALAAIDAGTLSDDESLNLGLAPLR